MKTHIAIFRFVLLSIAIGLSFVQVTQASSFVTVISKEKMTVEYRDLDGQLWQTCQVTTPNQFDFPEPYYYGSVLYRSDLRAEALPGRTFGWYTLEQDDPQTASGETSVSKCSVKVTSDLLITADVITAKAKRSARYGTIMDYILYPKYTYTEFNLVFDGNGKTSGLMSDVTGLTIDDDFTLPANTYVKTGYHFAGWKTNVTEGVVFEDEASVKGSDFWNGKSFDSKLYAIWNETSYGITCDPEGAGPASATFEEVFSVPDVTKTGYEFKGWKVEGADFSTARYGSSEGSVNTSLTSATVCRGADGKTWFRRLSSTGGSVRLVAQFEAKSYTVTFVNMGGTGGPTSMSVTYDDAKEKCHVSNVPSKGGNKFMGYYIEGVRCWDENGQYLKAKWDIPSDCTAYAQWEAKTFYVEYDANGGSGTIPSLFCTNGVEATLSDGAGFSRPGCTLLGWSTSQLASEPEYELGKTYAFDFTSNTKLYAIWEVSYYIGFDGFGATSGTMEPQKFKEGERKELTRNGYVKSGYSFGGWAKDETGARALKPDYQDGAFFAGTVDVPGSTNWLYAVWNTNDYYVAFSANGGTGPLPETIPCQYDHLVTIPAPSADLVKPPFLFSGWRDPVADVVYTNLPAVVSNLCDVADGTNTLFAVWKLSDLSEAMHCTNLYWESVTNLWHSSKIEWAGAYGEGEGFEGSGSCVRQPALSEVGIPQMLTAKLAESGTLSFRWKGTTMAFNISKKRDDTEATSHRLASGADEWNYFSTNLVVTAETWVHIYNYTPNSAADIDQMTWTPEGGEPRYVDVDSKVTGFSMVDGKLVFAFDATNDETSAYHLLGTNDLVAPMPWPMVFEIGKKPVGPHSFEIQIKENEPKMFYRIRALK